MLTLEPDHVVSDITTPEQFVPETVRLVRRNLSRLFHNAEFS